MHNIFKSDLKFGCDLSVRDVKVDEVLHVADFLWGRLMSKSSIPVKEIIKHPIVNVGGATHVFNCVVFKNDFNSECDSWPNL